MLQKHQGAAGDVVYKEMASLIPRCHYERHLEILEKQMNLPNLEFILNQ